MACHAVDKKLVGPAYKDVAANTKVMLRRKLCLPLLRSKQAVKGVLGVKFNAANNVTQMKRINWLARFLSCNKTTW